MTKMIEKYIVIDSRMCDESKKSLTNMGYELIEIDENPKFNSPISAHPDIFILKIGSTYVLDSGVNSKFTFLNNSVSINREEAACERIKYPKDVILNCACVGKKLICCKKNVHRAVLEIAEKEGYSIVNTNQGYSKCATCIVSSNAIITEDISIHNAAAENGIKSLLIEKGHVLLDGYDYGFIGGCSGLIEESLLAFNGNIKLHPDYNLIYDFCRKENVSIISLNENRLYDVGSIIRL